MEASSPASALLPIAVPERLPWYNWRRWGLNFLVVSIIAHVVFLGGATYFIVQTIHAKREQTFASPPKGPNAPTRALEKQVQMAKRKAAGAPASLKRVLVNNSVSKVSLPEVTDMPKMDAIVPMNMPGAGGLGIGPGFGSGGSGGGGGDGGGGGGLNFFGLRTGNGLVGYLYDLKQTAGRQPTGMTPALYGTKIAAYAKDNFNDSDLAQYYRAPKPVYALRIFAPDVPASMGPAAFGVEKEVEPKMWCVHYKGNVLAPEDGSFYFAGLGDDVLIVRFDGREVLNGSWSIDTGLKGQTHYKMKFNSPKQGFAKGIPFHVEAGHAYPIEVLIGEQPGGWSSASLFIGKEGEHYQQDANHDLLLPIFRMSDENGLPPPPPKSKGYAPHATGGPVWKFVAPGQTPNSMFSN